MKKYVKTALLIVLAGLLLGTTACGLLTGCGDVDADLVFVSDTAVPIGSVVLRTELNIEGCQNADGSPLGRGESFGFELESYPVTVTVYADVNGVTPRASLVISEEPEGDRWYVVAKDGPDGIVLELAAEWPEDR